MQRTELNIIIKVKEGKQYKSLMKFPCGIRQCNYNIQYKKALDTLKALENTGMECKLICKYLKTYIPNTASQLHLV